jgi:exodeoxyribonuclease-3
MRVVSWNVNGLRAVAKKGFAEFLQGAELDILGTQEVRASEAQVEAELKALQGWHTHIVAAQRPGYSGVGLFSKAAPDAISTSLGREDFDVEGRVQLARFGRLHVANVYFPNGNGKERDNSRIPYKLEFYARLFDILEPLRQTEPVLVLGDFNTAHKAIDLARPKQNEKTSGFCPEEREELDRWIRSGWIDSFRHFHPEPERYSWWSSRFGVREKNIGWRLDYVLVSPAVMPYLQDAFIWDHVMGSDHCPVGVELDPGILG